jgi:hypothetical protein
MEVFILQRGKYSDVSLEGVFTTLDKLNEFIEQEKRIFINYCREFDKESADLEVLENNGWEDFNTPIKITLDNLIPKDTLPYEVLFEKNGSIRFVSLNESSKCYWKEKYSISNPIYFKNTGIQLRIFCNARDKEHAIKIASDKRRELISNNLL